MNKNFITSGAENLKNIITANKKKTDRSAEVVVIKTAETPEEVADMRFEDSKKRKKVNLYADFAKRSLIKR